MKRMIDNKDYEELKKDVKDVSDVVEAHTTDFVVNQVVYDEESQKVTGFAIKDVENDVTYNVELGGGGEEKQYQHNIRIDLCPGTSLAGISLHAILINSTPNKMFTDDDYVTFQQFLNATPDLFASGVFWNASHTEYRVNGVIKYGSGSDENSLQFYYIDVANGAYQVGLTPFGPTVTASRFRLRDIVKEI